MTQISRAGRPPRRLKRAGPAGQFKCSLHARRCAVGVYNPLQLDGRPHTCRHEAYCHHLSIIAIFVSVCT